MSDARLYAVEVTATVYVAAESTAVAERIALDLVHSELDARVPADRVHAHEATRAETPAHDYGVTPWDAGCVPSQAVEVLDGDEADQDVEWWLRRADRRDASDANGGAP